MYILSKCLYRVVASFLCCLIWCTPSFGQEGQNDSTAIDTVSTTAGYATENRETVHNFDVISPGYLRPVLVRKIGDSMVNELRKDEDYWYANEKPEEEKVAPYEEPWLGKFLKQRWVHSLLWAIIIGSFIAVLIWFLAASNIKLFRREPAGAIPGNKAEPDNIFAIDYKLEIERATGSKDYRLVVRLMYLQLLTIVADKKIIDYRQERTNSDYVLQLYKTPYYKEFFSLTRSFEYTWYGKFPLSEEGFVAIKNDFITFKQKL